MKLHKNSRFKNKVRYLPSLALAAASLLAAGEAKAASFTFTTIASTASNSSWVGFTSLSQGLGTAGGWSDYDLTLNASQYGYANQKGISLSNSSAVAFFGTVKGIESVYTSNGTQFGRKRLVGTDGIYQSFGQGISINNQGAGKEDVAFFSILDNGENGIYLVENGTTSNTNLVNTKGILSSFGPGLSLNDSNTVAFLANLDSGGQEIFKSNGNPTTPTYITHCTTTNPLECPLGSSPENSPSINNNGTVAFASQNGVFTGSGGPASIIVSDPDSFWNGSYREANINNSGWVSAFAHNNGPGQIIFSANGSDGSIIAGNDASPINGGDFWYVGTNSINNKGKVAFMAKQANKGATDLKDKTGVGIYTGHDAVKDKVIAVGDYLLDNKGQKIIDSRIVDLSLDRQSLNDSNEIAFWAKFENGTEGIFRSNPLGDSQFNPLMPNCKINNGSIYSFCDVSNLSWYDPPVTEGFSYKTNDDSLFTSILDLPSTFENPFTVSVGDIVLGQFSNGDEINFSKYADLLGDLLIGGTGLKEFSVRTGDAIDPSNPMALPIKLAFNTETANFSMYALESVDQKKVPEPGTILGLLSVGSFLCYSGRRRQQKKN